MVGSLTTVGNRRKNHDNRTRFIAATDAGSDFVHMAPLRASSNKVPRLFGRIGEAHPTTSGKTPSFGFERYIGKRRSERRAKKRWRIAHVELTEVSTKDNVAK